MSVNNNNRGVEPFFAWVSNGSVESMFIIIVLSLLAADSLVLLGSHLMMPNTAVAQEAENAINNNTAASSEAPTGGNTNTTSATTNTTTPSLSSSSSGIHLSSQPIWEEQTRQTGTAPFNQTHSIITFFGDATLTVPDTGDTINVTDNGTAISSTATGTAYGRASVFSKDDGDSTAITFYEIMKTDPATTQTRGITIAAFDSNATGSLAPFNGMIVAGLHNQESILGPANITLWKWDDGLNNSGVATPFAPRQQEPVTNTTTTSALP